MTTTKTGRDGVLLVHNSKTGEISISVDTPVDEQIIVIPEKTAKTLADLLVTMLQFLESQK